MASDMNENVKRVLGIVKHNLNRGIYTPLSKEDSKVVREFYAEQVKIPLDGNVIKLTNELGTLIATGYNRIVVGDYGPYIEMTSAQIISRNIEQRWSGVPTRTVKYIWMVTKDEERTKLYWQQDTVPYADYQPGMYYVDPRIVFFD